MAEIPHKWSLDIATASDSAAAVLLLSAADRDNVDPLTILACEQFGSTLSMVSKNIEINAIMLHARRRTSLSFLEGMDVDFHRDDSAGYLRKSDGGRNFLALAAAIYIPNDETFGARVLEELLKDSASDPEKVPTRFQLQQVLSSVSLKFRYAGFAKQVVDARTNLSRGVENDLRDTNRQAREADISRRVSDYMDMVPGPDIIRCLVEVFRRVSRSKSAHAIIRTGAGAAWITAFTDWCLGYKPFIELEFEAVPAERVPDQKITLVLHNDITDTRGAFSVIMQDGSGDLNWPTGFLLASNDFHYWSGMLPLRQYWKYNIPSRCRALERALEHSIPRMRLVLMYPAGATPVSANNPHSLEDAMNLGQRDLVTRSLLRSFVSSASISSFALTFTPDDILASSAVRAYMLKQARKTNSNTPKEDFILELAALTMDVIVLSLVDESEMLRQGLRIKLHMHSHNPAKEAMRDTLLEICPKLFGSFSLGDYTQGPRMSPDMIHQWARGLFGQREVLPSPKTLISSGGGQVLTAMGNHSTGAFGRRRFELIVLRGQLMRRDSVYHSVQGLLNDKGHDLDRVADFTYPPPQNYEMPQVIHAVNLYPGLGIKLLLRPSPYDLESLQAGMILKDEMDPNESFQGTLCPSTYLSCPGAVVVATKCAHDPMDNPLETVNGRITHAGVTVTPRYGRLDGKDFLQQPTTSAQSGGGDEEKKEEEEEDILTIIPVAGAEDVGMFAAASIYYRRKNRGGSGGLILLRQEACMRCCLQICIELGARVLIM